MGAAQSNHAEMTDAQYRAAFKRFDRDRNDSIDAIELGTVLTSLFKVYMTRTQRDGLIKKFDKNGDDLLQFDEFLYLAHQFEQSLPPIAVAPRADPLLLFVSFGVEASIGLVLSLDKKTKKIRVDSAEGVAVEAGVVTGSTVSFMHTEELQLGLTTDELFRKVGVLKKTLDAFTIGFQLPEGTPAPLYDFESEYVADNGMAPLWCNCMAAA